MSTHRHAILAFLIVTALALIPLGASAQNGGLVPEDFYQDVGVAEVAISRIISPGEIPVQQWPRPCP